MLHGLRGSAKKHGFFFRCDWRHVITVTSARQSRKLTTDEHVFTSLHSERIAPASRRTGAPAGDSENLACGVGVSNWQAVFSNQASRQFERQAIPGRTTHHLRAFMQFGEAGESALPIFQD
jgi:hypothetical protein